MNEAGTLRPLEPEDAEALARLRGQALLDAPFAFSASPRDEHETAAFARKALADRDEQVVFGWLEGGELLGMAGLFRERGAKERHRARIWGMYVAPAARGRGVARALLQAALHHARTWPEVEQVGLGVTDAAPHARRLYEASGFRHWGTEPRALKWQGRCCDEHHLIFDLRPADPGSSGQAEQPKAAQERQPAPAARPASRGRDLTPRLA